MLWNVREYTIGEKDAFKRFIATIEMGGNSWCQFSFAVCINIPLMSL